MYFFPQHIIFQGTKAIHSCWKKYSDFWGPNISSQKERNKIYSFIKANKKYFSEQIKLDTFSYKKIHLLIAK